MDREIKALKAFVKASERLREAGVLRTPDLVADLGRWFVERLFGGVRALPGSKKGWDVAVPATGERYRIRAHLYDRTHPWSTLDGIGAGYTHLAVVILTPDGRLRDLYKVPRGHLPVQRRAPTGPYYRWNDLTPWRVEPASLPGGPPLTDLLTG